MNILRTKFPKDYLGNRGECTACGWECETFCYNFVEYRPAKDGANDWWVCCSNKDCLNHYGDTYGQSDEPEWWATNVR